MNKNIRKNVPNPTERTWDNWIIYLIDICDDPNKVTTSEDCDEKYQYCRYLLVSPLSGGALLVDSARGPDGSEQEEIEDGGKQEREESHDDEVGQEHVVSGVGEAEAEFSWTDGRTCWGQPGLSGVDEAGLQLHEPGNVPDHRWYDDGDNVEPAWQWGEEVPEECIETLMHVTDIWPGMNDCNVSLQSDGHCGPDGPCQRDLGERQTPGEDVRMNRELRRNNILKNNSKGSNFYLKLLNQKTSQFPS